MKISILVKVYEYLGFDQNCRKILILVNIFGKSWFFSMSYVKSIVVEIFPKSWFWSKFSKNVNLGKKFANMSTWSKI